jgi:hypothetical protein
MSLSESEQALRAKNAEMGLIKGCSVPRFVHLPASCTEDRMLIIDICFPEKVEGVLEQ